MTAAKPDISNTSSGACARELMRLLDEQISLLEGLDEMSRRQRALGEGDDLDALNTLLDDRQRVIERLESLSARIGPLRSQWEEGVPAVREHRTEVMNRLVRVSELAGAITKRDESDMRAFEARRARIGEELASSRRGHRASGAYAGTQPDLPGFQDYHA